MLLIGWDAADWSIITPLVKSGKMPALAGLMAKGGWGNIATLDPPISPMLWTSIATGKRPYKHGVYGFTEAGPDGNARPVRSTSRTTKAIWNILNDNGLKTNVVGWWPSHPAEPVNGCMVSNFFGVDGAIDFLHDAVNPAEVADTLAEFIIKPEELTEEIVRPFFPEAGDMDSANDAMLRSVMRILAQTATTHAAATYVLENSEWQFGAVYLDAIDHFCHLAMRYHPPQMPGVSDESFRQYHYIVEAAYRFHDMMLERLLAIAGPDCHVILVSDHGFENGANRLLSLPDEPGAPALEHNPYGVLVASGEAFKRETIYGASILDVTPTILQFFGLPQAEDMDGRVLPIFRHLDKKGAISSYETGNLRPGIIDKASSVDTTLLNQLAALGYINSPAEADSKSILAENEFYLARSLADGQLLDEALIKAQRLVEVFPNVTRYTRFYASLLLRLGYIEPLKGMIDSWEQSHYKTYVQGLIYLNSGKPMLAAKTFEEIPAKGNSTILTQTAEAWRQSGYADFAEKFAQEALQANPNNQKALNLLGEIYLDKEAWESAIDFFFKSLSLLYYQPKVHQNIGVCLYCLGYYADAALALQLALQYRPGLLAAADLLRDIYTNHLNDPQKLAALNLDSQAEPVYIVTGFPRSGTSMMMQVLAAGGLPVLTDGSREADRNNPKGYLEFEEVKNLGTDQSFLNEAGGKAVKIVMPMLRFVHPSRPLKVIWMVRDETTIVSSQQKMKGETKPVIGFELLQSMQKETQLMEAWLNRYPNVAYIKFQYTEVVANPAAMVKRLKNFIGGTFNEKACIMAIDAKLNHH